MELIAIAAVSENNVIGRDGELPWPSVPGDKEQYRKLVADSPVILGRRTFDAMRDDLPGANQLVLTRDPNRTSAIESVEFVESVDGTLNTLESQTGENIYVLGGGGIYEAFFPYLVRLRISRIPGRYKGDRMFPPIDPEQWVQSNSENFDYFRIESWDRRDGNPIGDMGNRQDFVET